jgi:multisubunit Na+/H+ antiporter MnhB subunit
VVGSHWPLPSESRRVRTLLYLTEGVAVGSVAVAFLLAFTDGTLVTDTGALRSSRAIVRALLYGVVALLVLGVSGVVDLWRGDSADQGDEDLSPAFRDWRRVRRRSGVAVVALVTGGLLLAVSLLQWGWPAIVLEWSALLSAVGTFVVALLLYIYVLYRIDAGEPRIPARN